MLLPTRKRFCCPLWHHSELISKKVRFKTDFWKVGAPWSDGSCCHPLGTSFRGERHKLLCLHIRKVRFSILSTSSNSSADAEFVQLGDVQHDAKSTSINIMTDTLDLFPFWFTSKHNICLWLCPPQHCVTNLLYSVHSKQFACTVHMLCRSTPPPPL